MAAFKDIKKTSFFAILGSAMLYLKEAFADIINGRIQKEQFVSRLVFIGYECLPMIILLTSLATMILTVNTAIELNSRGGRELVGSLIAMASMREIVPIFIGFAVAARCGTALTAEVSTMKVTEQIDALRVLKIRPVYYLLSPTLLAVLVLVPFILAIASLISIISGMVLSKYVVNIEFSQFMNSVWSVVSLQDYFLPLIKAEIFSLYALLMNITMGLDCNGGAREVGMATTRATALVIVGIVILNGFLTPLLF